MLSGPFLSELDSRAQVKGSRDPLGVQGIWMHFGRHVVGNLTNASASLRDFTVTLCGFHFAERAAERREDRSMLAAFLMFEQLAAYARAHVLRARGFRGTERTWRRLNEGARVTLSTEASCQILGDQKIYGLWGLYTVPSHSSGLLEGEPTRLTAAARELVEREYLPAFGRAHVRADDVIPALLSKKRYDLDLDGRDKPLVRALARILDTALSPREIEVYRQQLLLDAARDSTRGLQRELATLLSPTFKEDALALSPRAMHEHAARAREQGLGRLADHLDAIRTAESVLARAVNLSGFVLGLDNTTVADAAADVRKTWGERVPGVDPAAFEALRDDLARATTGADDAERWLALARAFAAGDYDAAIRRVVEINSAAMRARRGTPWLELDRDRIRVRYRDASSRLASRSELPEMWLHSYFLGSFHAIGHALTVGAAS